MIEPISFEEQSHLIQQCRVVSLVTFPVLLLRSLPTFLILIQRVECGNHLLIESQLVAWNNTWLYNLFHLVVDFLGITFHVVNYPANLACS
jgi:hypothetical protein